MIFIKANVTNLSLFEVERLFPANFGFKCLEGKVYVNIGFGDESILYSDLIANEGVEPFSNQKPIAERGFI